MKRSIKDRAEGALHEVKGRIKQEAGQRRNDEAMVDEGTDERIAGKVQKAAGKVEKKLGA